MRYKEKNRFPLSKRLRDNNEYIKPIKDGRKVCPVCGKIFFSKVDCQGKYKNKYCSKKCARRGES